MHRPPGDDVPGSRAHPAGDAGDARTFLRTWLDAQTFGDADACARALLARAAPSFAAKARSEADLARVLANPAFAPWTHRPRKTIVDVDVIDHAARAVVRSDGPGGNEHGGDAVDYVVSMTSRAGPDADDEGWWITGLSPAARTWDR